jgi:phosphatidylglycerol:prolipoprotein diacylglycerol transferase
MHQIAFKLGPITVHWYGIMVALGFLAATGIMQWKRKYANLKTENVSDITLYSMIAGIVGARIFYVIEFWSKDFSGRPILEIFRIDKGGLVFYGGFICALVTMILYCRWKKLPIFRVLDLASPAIALGHALGRVGCFLNGCCFGKVCNQSLGAVYPPGTAPAIKYPDYDHAETILVKGQALVHYFSQHLHPVQLYETTGNIIICIVLLLMMKRLKTGQVAALYVFLYGVLRFVDEFFRGDHTDYFMGVFTPAQTIGLVLIPVGIIAFCYFRLRKDPDEQTSVENN